MGVFINSKNDTELYESAKRVAISIIKSAKIAKSNQLDGSVLAFKKDEREKHFIEPKLDSNQGYRGFYIRCSKYIPIDPARPFCIDCFTVWVQWSNLNFQENFCHSCGENGQIKCKV